MISEMDFINILDCKDLNVTQLLDKSSLNDLLGQITSKQPVYLISAAPSRTASSLTNSFPLSELPAPNITQRSESLNSSSSSVLGSPLKLNAIANLNLSNSSSPPISNNNNNTKKLNSNKFSIHNARKLINKYLALELASENSAPMICCLCDAEDSQRTVLMGALREVINKQLVVKTFLVTLKTTTITALDQLTPKPTRNGSCFHMNCTYKVLDSSEGLGSITLEVDWSDRCGKVKVQHLGSAHYSLAVRVQMGNDQSPVFNHFCRLQRVGVLVNGLKTGQLPAVLTSTCQGSAELLDKLLDKLKLGTDEALTCLSDQHGLLCGLNKKLKLEPRSDLDFTDLVWDVLYACSTYQEIIHCFAVIFRELNGGNLKAYVHSSNQTTLAKLTRQSYSKNAAFPSLTGQFPLLMMVELGLEFITKNYCALFLNNKLCSKSEWSSFAQSQTKDTGHILGLEELGVHTCSATYDTLMKLHHCLEVASVVDAFTEEQDIAAMTQAVMKYYRDNNLSEQKTFSFSLTALDASQVMSKAPVSFIRRERVEDGISVVENVACEYPEVLGESPLPVSLDTTNNDSEYFYLQTRESVHFLQKYK